MKRIAMTLAVVIALGAGAAVAAVRPCEELKAEIDAKLQAKGVRNYTLEILLAADVKDQTIIGSCEGGTKKIAYTRNSSAAPAAK